jgi:hypothetical protein
MSVRAKFRVTSVTRMESEASRVTLAPVTSGSEENKAFYKWTPGGSISLETINTEASKQFEPGKEFFVDFTPAES